MAAQLHFLDQRRLIDSNGIADGAEVYFYLSGTTTKTTIYSDYGLTTPIANPVVVPAGAAMPDVYYDDAISIRRYIVYSDGETDDTDPYVLPSILLEAKAAKTAAEAAAAQSLSYSLTSLGASATTAAHVEASRRLLTTVSAVAMAASAPAAYDLADEFAGGAVGDYWVIDKSALWQDTARTVPVTAVGDPVACIDSARGNRDYDLIQSDVAKQGTYQEVMGKGCVRRALGDGYASRATVTLTVPSFLGVAATFGGTDGRYLFGLNKNTNTRHVFAPATNVRMSADTDSNAPDAARQWKTAYSADGSGPKGPATVYTSLLDSGKVDCVVEDSIYRGQIVEIATDWANGENATGCYVVLGATSNTTVFTDATGDFYGGIVLGAVPADREGIVATLQAMCRPQITEADRVIVVIGDSTGDDIDTTAQTIAEMFYHWASNGLQTSHAGECISYRRWTANADCLVGYENLANPTATDRTFVINASRAGSQPDYFFAERFSRALGWLPKVDTVIWNHGHNLPVSDAAIQAEAKDYLYRAGIYTQALDALRTAFPKARHMMVKTWPVSSAFGPSDTRIDSQNEAVAHVADLYGDVELIDLYTVFDGYTPSRSPTLYAPDGLHPSALGASEASAEIATTYDGFAAVPAPTPALIAQRRISYSENLLANGAFEAFTADVPDSWTTYGDGAAIRSNEWIGRGQTVKVTGSNGGIEQTIDCTAMQGKVAALTVVGTVLGGSDLDAATLTFLCNGTATIGDGRWSQPAYRSEDSLMTRNHFFPVPADATTLTVRIAAGIGGAGTLYLDRVVLAEGTMPRDIVL